MAGKYYTKSERSKFGYWFAHWNSFQMTALRLGCWKPRYFLHDIEKPWLRLFMPYEKVQKRHRSKSSHHIEYFCTHGAEKTDWAAMVIDWECSRFTKWDAPRNAVDTLHHLWPKLKSDYGLTDEQCSILQYRVRSVLRELGCYEATTYFSRPTVASKFIARILRPCSYVVVALADWNEALRTLKLTRLIETDGRDKDIYITPDGCSYVLKNDCENENNECRQIIIFSYHEAAFNRTMAALNKAGITTDVLNEERIAEVKNSLTD